MNRLYTLFMFTFPLLSSAQCVEGDCLNGSGSFKFLNGTYVGQLLNLNSQARGHSKHEKDILMTVVGQAVKRMVTALNLSKEALLMRGNLKTI